MARSEVVTTRDGSDVERAARLLGVEAVSDVARAALAAADESATRRCGREAAVAAAVCLAARRSSRTDLSLAEACEALGVHHGDAARAEASLRTALSPPADPAAIAALRRGLVAVREVLLAAERGRVNPPRLPPGVLASAAPSVLTRTDGSLDDLDRDELRAHVERLEADLDMARLGVELYARVHGD